MLQGYSRPYTLPLYHQIITQQRPKGPWSLGVVGGRPKVAIFQPTHGDLKTK